MRIHSVVFGLCARESLMILNNIMLCLNYYEENCSTCCSVFALRKAILTAERTALQSALLYFRPEKDHSDSRMHRTAVRAAVFSPRKRPF